jgi:hypothetical protein
MAAEISREHQATLDLHKIMLEAMRAREGEILRFVAFLLPAIGGLFASLWLKGPNGPVPFHTIFLITTLTVIILLFFGGWYTLALSYNYRSIQFVVWRLQKHLTLDRFQPEAWRRSWRQSSFLRRALFDFAPEIFRTQVLLFCAIILALVFTITRRALELPPCVRNLVVLVAVLALGLLEYLGSFFYPRKYHKLDEELK